tara:strand:+ start:567 stop:1181 length:615 start_codon:yes stop_codon:yes gene_type:complete
MHILWYISCNLFGNQSFFTKILYALFSIDLEMTIPAWYQGLLLMACAISIIINDLIIKLPLNKYCILFSIIFITLSIDEVITIRERIEGFYYKYFLNRGYILSFEHDLIFSFLVLSLIILIAYISIKFLSLHNNYNRKLFILSGFIYVFGALGLDLIGSNFEDKMSLIYQISTMLEELFEMIGLIIFLHVMSSIIFSKLKNLHT